MAASPAFVATPKVGIMAISTANTNRDGTGTIGTVLSAGASGSRIENVNIKATGTTTAGMVRLFIHDGSTAHLLIEIPVIAITPAATLPAFQATVSAQNSDVFPLIIPTGYSLRASTNNAESFNVIAQGGDL